MGKIVLVECYADALFVKALTTQVCIKHMGGRSRIIKSISNQDVNNVKAMIDEDPNSVEDRRLQSYQPVMQNAHFIA
ncbi:MAG: hypothetical protein RMI32_06240 [Candidatus Nitrosocaldus sp.]|nr:hypothetical protein [Candidatus Nitrosocaldus sp.]